ncbi:DUF2270 domain-containing protein [Halolamina salifodinae]|uniref:Putative membrane protein n=1 Tax=Halolamina salifodinae TaxID=1202767 RepID=A0A8T4GXN8_9EURY|nr:DUF2270 domain-containing protein [Halolamina salifodinae]MBP1986863.1 putative membrane protein [Halolamina salifodinae]
MSDDAPPEVDPTDPEYRNVGEGLLDEEMGPSSAMAHLYRGEVHRMKFWRERLDRTTRWAVIVVAAIVTWAFSSPDNPHYVLLVGVATLGIFLTIEARRYRGYEIWRSRVRIMQENVWAYGLDPSVGVADEAWREKLSRDYRTPTLKISAEEALAHRLRRIYLPLSGVVLAAWLIRVTAFSSEPFPASAAVGMIPGTAVTAAVGLVYLAAVVVACRPRTWHAKGELRAEELRKRNR